MDEWITVKVDNLLPDRIHSTSSKRRKRFHSTSSNTGELWSAYAEKAYAKRYGGYDSINGGKGIEAMVDLTGGFAVSTRLNMTHADKTFNFLFANQSNLIMTSAIFGSASNETELESGLFDNHAYSLLQLAKVQDNDNNIVRLVRIRNPWGNSKEFKGNWSDNSNKWNTLPHQTKERLYLNQADGAFWMLYEDWIDNFDEYSFCFVPTNTYNGFVGMYNCI